MIVSAVLCSFSAKKRKEKFHLLKINACKDTLVVHCFSKVLHISLWIISVGEFLNRFWKPFLYNTGNIIGDHSNKLASCVISSFWYDWQTCLGYILSPIKPNWQIEIIMICNFIRSNFNFYITAASSHDFEPELKNTARSAQIKTKQQRDHSYIT